MHTNHLLTPRRKKAAAALLCASFALGGVSAIPGAAVTMESFAVQTADTSSLPESDILFNDYVNRTLGISSPDNGKLPFSSGRKSLSQLDQVYYDFLYESIVKVANGELSDTVFTVSKSELRSKVDVGTNINDFSLENVIGSLLLDCPYDLYWYDKTAGIRVAGNFTSFTFSCPVSADYSVSGTAGTYNADVSKTSAASAAKSTVKSIIDGIDPNWSDYAVMNYFKESVCELVSYNDDAAQNSSSVNYGDPWQLIYVFDGDVSTNVVCEGYSKAFKYLCDTYNFNSDVECSLVSGMMSTASAHGYSSGGHMWNLVSINGVPYHVDVTNSDTRSVGQSGELYFAGASGDDRIYSGSTFAGYTISTDSSKVTYQYDNDTLSMFGAEELAIADASPKLHRVLWKDKDGSVLETDSDVADGERPVFNGELPSHEDMQFIGWSPEINDSTVILGDTVITYTALFDQKMPDPIEIYTVSFLNLNGTLFYNTEVEDGGTVDSVPTPSSEYMNFKGWYLDEEHTKMFDENEPVKSELVLYPRFTCTVEWYDHDGTLLYSTETEYGEVPLYPGETPQRPDSEGESYEFIGWTPDIEPAFNNTSYIASYRTVFESYTVVWHNYDGTVLEVDDNLTYGDIPSYDGETPVRTLDNGTELIFNGWTPDIVPVTEDADYYAEFESPDTNTYKISWLNYDGSVLSETWADEGQLPSYDGTTPVRESDEKYDYEFTGWSPELTPADSDEVYFAEYSQTYREYTVRWFNYNGELLTETEFTYGETPYYPYSAPERIDPNDDLHIYVFDGWSPEVEPVTGDTDYIAVFYEYTVDPDPDPQPDPDPDPQPDPDPDPKPDPDLTDRVLGDINNDGTVDSLDALIMLRASIGMVTVEEEDSLFGDVDANGVIDSSDAVLTLRYSVGINDEKKIGFPLFFSL